MPKARAIKRCAWSLGVSDAYQAYHDDEWGVPVRDDRKQFEFLILEGAQAGLSWSTVLHKRDGYRQAFAGFDPEKVARFSKRKIESLLNNPAIIRNRLKVASAVTNAQALLRLLDTEDSFSDYIWGFVDGRPVQNRWKGDGDVPASTPVSDALSMDLKKRGFKFVGTTIVYAHMQATGLVNDHIVGCYRHAQCKKLAQS
ncbi:MAG: DNA-3-methyladenine glycosylase I [Gammaproteobacteria bacterium]|nr:DNA-3-methyladenine glycosylase I [Gammaproteobacteria bacterium]NND37497.1 DNA-3-methyladenine glycosylase I [Gammaproteobacteria bacterium]